jgi:hypothetical protein
VERAVGPEIPLVLASSGNCAKEAHSIDGQRKISDSHVDDCTARVSEHDYETMDIERLYHMADSGFNRLGVSAILDPAKVLLTPRRFVGGCKEV